MDEKRLQKIEERWNEANENFNRFANVDMQFEDVGIVLELISTVKELQDELNQYKAFEALKSAGVDIRSHKEVIK